MAFAPAREITTSDRQKIRKFFFDIFILNIAFGTFEGFVHFTLAAEMDHLESFQKFRENLADMVIYRGCAKLPPITISTGLSEVNPQN